MRSRASPPAARGGAPAAPPNRPPTAPRSAGGKKHSARRIPGGPDFGNRGLSENRTLRTQRASVDCKLMRRVVAVLVACTPHAAAAAALVAREQSVLESGAPAAAPVDDVHQPFTTVLSSVHATLFNVTRDVETVEQSGPGSGPVSQLRQHTESALYEIEQVLGLCPHRPTAPARSPACALPWC